MKTDKTIPNKSEITPDPKRQPDGKFGPGNIANPKGRPKRKTLTEMIHAKLDEKDSSQWEEIVKLVIEKILTEKDKDVLKTFWQYTDGMPKQSTDITTGGEKIAPQFVVQSKEAKKQLEKLYEGSDSSND